jgi:hypothetical protein
VLSTAWQRMATFGRRMVRAVCGSHLSPVATCRQTVEVFYSAVHRLAADGYVWEAEGSGYR